MQPPYVSVLKVKGVFKLVVDYRTEKKTYALTEKDLLKAGVDLYEAGFESWLHSSSLDVDFKEYYGVDVDAHELMERGFKESLNEREAPRQSVINKMFDLCNNREFMYGLTSAELKAFKKLLQEREK